MFLETAENEKAYAKREFDFLNGVGDTEANLKGADLRLANLTEAKLIGAYLSDAYLFMVKLDKADLSKANLSGATIQGSNLYDAVLCHTITPWGNDNSGCPWGLR